VKECVEEKPFIYKLPGFIVAFKNNEQTKQKNKVILAYCGQRE